MTTFPQSAGQLPQKLNPFHLYHYALVTYWVFFRPSACHSYLYHANPEVYRLSGGARFWRSWSVPAYRRLYLMLPIAILFAVILAGIGLWFYRQGMTAGHTSWVNSVAISGNGQVMVTAAGDRFERVQVISTDATIKVWNLQQGKELQTLRGHESTVSAVAITTDGKTAVSGGRDRTLRVWDLDRGKSSKTLKGHRGWITTLDILPNQAQVISASVDHTLKLWNLASGENIRTFTGHDRPVVALAITKDGQQLVSGSEDQTVKVWEVATGNLQQTLTGHGGWVTQVAITADQKKVVSASTDNQIKVWDLAQGQEIATLPGHTSTINALEITQDGHYAVSASADRTVRVWDLQENKLLHTLTGHQGWVTDLALTPQGKIISGSSDRTAKIWDLATGKLEHTLQGHQSWVRTVSATPDGQQVISTGFERFPKLWAVNNGQEVALGGVKIQQFLLNLGFASCASLAAMLAIAAMGIFLIWGLIFAGGLGTIAASLLITGNNSILLSGALVLLDRFRNNPSFKEQINPEAFVIVLYLLFGTILGFTLGAASGLSGRRATGVFSSLLSTLVLGFASAMITIFLFTAAISIKGRVLPAITTFKTVGIWFNLMVAVGAFRLPVYCVEFISSLATFGRGKDQPILWDELLVLPLPGSSLFLQKQLQLDPIAGLEQCLAVMVNPWQRALAQRVLFNYLHRHPTPLKVLYTWLENPVMSSYISAPVSASDWQLLPATRQVLLGELAQRWVDPSTDGINSLSDRLIWLLTSWQRNRKITPLSQFCLVLYRLDTLEIPSQQPLTKIDLSFPQLPYPAGKEISEAFQLIQEFLSYQQLANFLVIHTSFPDLPVKELTNSLELNFLAKLQQLLLIRNKIIDRSPPGNTLEINPLRPIELLQELQLLRGDLMEIPQTPEIKVLEQIIHQWQEMILS